MEQSAIYWAQQPLRKYADFTGRARRAEYWWFTLAVVIAAAIAALIDGILGMRFGLVGGPLYLIVSLGAFLPSLGVAVRRLHDVNRSGWWYLIALIPLIGAIVLLVWFCTRGTIGTNQFGPDPLDPSADVAEVFS